MRRYNTWKYAESLLYNFTKYLTYYELISLEYQELRNKGDVNAQSYQEHLSTHTRDPVAEYHEKLTRMLHKINLLLNKIRPVEILIQDLTNPYALDKNFYQGLLDVLCYIYFGHNKVQETACILEIDESTIYRRKRRLVKMLIPYAKKHTEK